MFWFRLKDFLPHFLSNPVWSLHLILAIWLGLGGIIWLLGSAQHSWLEVLKNNDGTVAGLNVDPGNIPSVVLVQLPAPDDNTPLRDAGKIKALAEKYELYHSCEPNPHLCFDSRVISYWSERGWPAWELELQFLSRRLVLQAAERAHAQIPSQGDLSKWSKRIYPILFKKAQEK